MQEQLGFQIPLKMDRVCGVVVTYNRKDMLRDCLKSLLAQTRPLDQIVIVNNASTDGTPALIEAEFPQLTALHLAENSGGAGGFHAGMKWAHENGFDWVWVMDDDIETVPGALETMLGYKHIGDLIQSRKQHLNGILIWESIWDVSSCSPVSYRKDVSFENGKQWTSISYANFEGALIHRKVMDKVGYPDVRYFMAGDDTIYGYQASLHASVIYINYVGIQKKMMSGQTFTPLHYYLQQRNRFLTYEHLANSGLPLSKKDLLVSYVPDGSTDGFVHFAQSQAAFAGQPGGGFSRGPRRRARQVRASVMALNGVTLRSIGEGQLPPQT